MKIKVLCVALIFFVFSCKQKSDQRKMNFPSTVEYVEEMPNSDSLWIFIMAGQSNMAGRGFVEPQDTIPNKRILSIDKSDNWIYAKEPLNLYQPSLTGLDCGLSFAHKLIDSIPKGISIGIINCAVGGSSIEQWLEDETFQGVKLLSNFKREVNQSQKYGEVKGILWHQGEANAFSVVTPDYADKLRELTNTFREIVKNDTLPIFIGQLGSYAKPIEKQNRWDSINTIINDFVEKDLNTYLIYTRDLKDKGDKVHFDSESQRQMGSRYADKYLKIAKHTMYIKNKRDK